MAERSSCQSLPPERVLLDFNSDLYDAIRSPERLAQYMLTERFITSDLIDNFPTLSFDHKRSKLLGAFRIYLRTSSQKMQVMTRIYRSLERTGEPLLKELVSRMRALCPGEDLSDDVSAVPSVVDQGTQVQLYDSGTSGLESEDDGTTRRRKRTRSISPGNESLPPSKSSAGEISLDVKQEVLKSLSHLRSEYMKMIRAVKTLFIDKIQMSQLSDFIENFEGFYPNKFSHCSNMQDIFTVLQSEMCIFNVHPLWEISRLCNVTGALELVKKFDKKSKKFTSSTSVGSFKAAVSEELKSPCPRGKQTLMLRLGSAWAPRTLEDLKHLVYNVFGLYSKVLVDFSVMSGSIMVSWLVPDSVAPILMMKTTQNRKLLALEGVEEVLLSAYLNATLGSCEEKLSFAESVEGNPIKELVSLRNEVTALEGEVSMLKTNSQKLQEELANTQKINTKLSKQLEREVTILKAKTLSLQEELGTTQKIKDSLSKELEYAKSQLLSASHEDDDVPMNMQDGYEKTFALSAHQKELLQEEQHKAASSKEMEEARDQQKFLMNELVQICQLLNEVSGKSTSLTKNMELLNIVIERKQIKQKKILAASTSDASKELLSELVDEVHLSILDLKENLQHLDSEISEQRAKEEQVKQELAKKVEGAAENLLALEELKEKEELFGSELDSQKETLVEDLRQAENRHDELNHILQDIHLSLQPLTMKCEDLAEEKEQLEKDITEKEKLQEELMSQKALMGDTRIFGKLKDDIQASIEKSKKRLAHMEEKIEKQRNKKKRLEQEAAKNEKEVDKNKRLVHELKQKHSVVCSTLEVKRKIFDSQLRQKHQSKEKLPEECKLQQEQQSQVMAIRHDVRDGTHLFSVKPKEEVVRMADFYTSFKTPVQTITGINHPQYIAFHGSGDMFVTDLQDSVYVYDCSGRRKATIGTSGSGHLEFRYPYGIAISGDTVYVADAYNHRVQSFTTSGKFVSTFGSRGSGTGQFIYPRGISIDRDNRVYISDSGNHRIQVFRSDWSFIWSFDGNVSGKVNFKSPYGLTIAPDGNLFIAGMGSNNVTVLTHEGRFVRSFEVKYPTGVAVDGAGFSFVTTYANPGLLSIFHSNGCLIRKIEGFNFPRDVELSLDGSVWISEDCGNKLYKY